MIISYSSINRIRGLNKNIIDKSMHIYFKKLNIEYLYICKYIQE